jgi:ADP-heptose:LPS heptosyltransferase
MFLRRINSESLLYAFNVFLEKWYFKSYTTKSINRLLVVKWDEIGDMATSTHVFELLKKKYPDSQLTVLCKPFVKPLIQNDPFVNHVICELDAIKRDKFDVVVELRGTWQTLVWAVFNRPLVRVSRAVVRYNNRGNQQHEVLTNFQVISPLIGELDLIAPQLYYSNEDIKAVDVFLENHQCHKFVLFHVGARKKLRQWNVDRFAFVADNIISKHQLAVVFIGTQEDEADIVKIQSLMKCKSISFTQNCSLSMLSYLCSKSQLFIGNESGPIHISACFSAPIIGLYGPGVPHVFYPYSRKVKVFHHVLKCNPCDQIHCVTPEKPCISLIGAAEVSLTVDKILNENLGV